MSSVKVWKISHFFIFFIESLPYLNFTLRINVYMAKFYFQLRICCDPRNPARVQYLKTDLIVLKSHAGPVEESTPDEAINEYQEEVRSETHYYEKEGIYMCKICSKTYKKLGSMKAHIEKNHGIQNSVLFLCKNCTKSFDTQKKLTRHQNSKTQCC